MADASNAHSTLTRTYGVQSGAGNHHSTLPGLERRERAAADASRTLDVGDKQCGRLSYSGRDAARCTYCKKAFRGQMLSRASNVRSIATQVLLEIKATDVVRVV